MVCGGGGCVMVFLCIDMVILEVKIGVGLIFFKKIGRNVGFCGEKWLVDLLLSL